MLSGEATNTNLLVFGLTRSGVEPLIYHIQREHNQKSLAHIIKKVV
jgi:hypothetical protein